MVLRHLPTPPAFINAPVDNLDNPRYQHCPQNMAAPFDNNASRSHNYAYPILSGLQNAGEQQETNHGGGGGGGGGESGSGQDNMPKHTRSYQACNACRARKTKCVMGNPDKPHEGPCEKCARERKQCVFEATRKRTDKDRPNGEPNRNTQSKKRTASDASFDEPMSKHCVVPLSPLNNHMQSPTTYSSNGLYPVSPMLSSPPADNVNMAPPRSVPQSIRKHVQSGYTGSRAVNNLKAENSLSSDEQFRSPLAAAVLSDQVASSQQGIMVLLKAAGEAQGQTPSVTDSPQSESRRSRTYSGGGARNSGLKDFEPSNLNAQQAEEIRKATQVWSHVRYVRDGWFTAQEAMVWIEKFYAILAPLTPVTLPNYRTPAKHYDLLTEEPVLALTILTIASRQFPFEGPASTSRSHNIHDKLWNSLRALVEKLLWAQEQFGGGFCGAGATPVRESETGQLTWKGSVRTLGTIEALLLLTDWQPRALHFPPGASEGRLLDTDGLEAANNGDVKDDESTYGTLPFAAALEPAWRSDRMSWMLLGLAKSLSDELGVFNATHANCKDNHGKDSECVRKRRIRRLMHTYVSQTSGRLGIKSTFSPHEDGEPGFDDTYKPENIDIMHMSWLELAQIMFDANSNIFATHKQTRDLTTSGDYKAEIDKLAPRLARWKKSFDANSHRFHQSMKVVLLMEYEYARMFINSVGFNRVVELWRASGPHVLPSALVQITEENKGYINEVREASASLVVSVLSGFADQKQLRNAPIRTYLRSFSGMVFSLKLFSLGNHEKTVRKSLGLLVHVADAMESQSLDDVHISNMIAQQVHTLAESVKRSMIRISNPGNGSNPSSREHSLRPAHGQEQSNTIKDNPRVAQTQLSDLSPDPLAEIQARPYAEYSEHAFMPPPGFGLNDDDALDFDPNIDPTMQLDYTDWFTLPLDNVLAHGNQPVEPGLSGLGPSIGDKDLLDFLAPSDSNLFASSGQWNGMGNQNSTNAFGGMDGF